MSNFVDPQTPGTEPQVQSSGSGNGCLWGCLIAGGLFIGSILCAGFGGYWFLSNQIAKYTSETPIDLPTVEYSEEDLAELDARVETFREKLDAGETPEEDLVLTADDINALISKNEDFKGKVYVKIENNQVEGDVSIPLDKLPMGKGRYFNGSATFDVAMDGGVLIVTVDQAELNGEPLPDEFMQAMRQENLAKDVYKDPENAKFMSRFEDIRIEDDKFILRVKRGGEEGVQTNPMVEPGDETATVTETATETGESEADESEADESETPAADSGTAEAVSE
ncbi:hypothetical protein Enr13x_52000 [Stieleria neptunia]|uniref:Uncharacterized protein n=1 Tax=Stieleria neptunia TaxID=2527979 RepID=A0A518HX31_9BACT|nr:hypothetical protein [Stieleria neptunia]QDV45324.1 hypothetical protein Enr13x_52000 [Stieleria neptunia]